MSTPRRKKPQCQSCGTPMAGHRRPNGSPICPPDRATPPPPSAARDKLSPPPSPTPSTFAMKDDPRFIFDAGSRVIRYINDKYMDSRPPPPIFQEFRSHSWTTTEPADDIPSSAGALAAAAVKREFATEVIDADETESIAASSTSSTTTIRLTRSFTKLLSRSMPLASIFRTPKEDISTVTQAARDQGLYTALMHHPQPNLNLNKGIKVEPSTASLRPQRQSSWWVVLGSDAGAVSHLADLHEKNAIGALEFGQRNENVGTYPPEAATTSTATWVLLILIFNFIGAFTMWFLLSAAY